MTTLLIPPPAVPVEVTAEHVVAYLLRPGSGWTPTRPASPDAFYRESAAARAYAFIWEGEVDMETITDIARAEGRHPSAVLADIVGPARAERVGAFCEPGLSLGEMIERVRCSAAHGAGESEAE